MRALLRFFFYLLYHPFAFTYDLVATTVSLGRWKDWVLSVVPFIQGNRILEIGHGPGHLQRVLLSRGLTAVGIDESAPMGRFAKRNLRRFVNSKTSDATSKSTTTTQRAYAQVNLTRGLGQHLPFSDEAFNSIVATFPSEYITESETLSEIKRCLIPGGRFIILPVATLMGRGILDRLMASVFQVTHQVPEDPLGIFGKRFARPFLEAGFQVQVKQLEVKSSLLLIVVAIKLSH